MSSATDPQPDPAADEIVAYLDGELAPQDCRRVESRLATDEEYRQELHELDRAWEALDVLPASTVNDGFARTTIELACVAAEADLTDRTAAANVANRNRVWRWIAAGVAASVFGFIAGRALIPHHNGALLADLPAIQQQNVLPYVEDVEFLRLLSAAVPTEQFVKDESVLVGNMKELEYANSPSFEMRREWVQSLPSERKAELADRARAFSDLEPASEEREHMRQVMEDVRNANEADKVQLQKTLVAYGLWLSRHTSAEKELLLEQFRGLSSAKQVEVVRRHIEQDERLAARHLKPEDAEKLRQEIVQIGLENKNEMQERMQNARKGMRNNDDGAFKADKREATSKRLVGKLSEAEQAHWNTLDRPRKAWQLGTWIQDAMKQKADPEKLEEFFAGSKLTPEQRQKLLDKPYSNMKADLERMYIRSELGIENPEQFFGEPRRVPWGGPGMGSPRDGDGPNRPPGFNPDRGQRPEGPGERRPRNRPPRPPGDGPPPEGKPEAI